MYSSISDELIIKIRTVILEGVCFTLQPNWLGNVIFQNQQFWSRGGLQTVRKHRDIITFVDKSDKCLSSHHR